ncbi:MAG: Rieske 2Fe-2S domain-containing protein [Actinomycetota bacterium]|nr:Rieske 2Fe-2S domain-containing protein [Actinomycetota bacterium]
MTETEEPREPEVEEDVDRRHLLRTGLKVLGVALVAEAAWTSYDILHPSEAGGFGGEVDAGPVADYTEEGTVQYFLNGRFYVTQYQGGLRALYQKCPHLGCRVPFCDTAQQFQCPCHGSIYNVIGEYLGGPTPRGLDRFPIRIQDGRVLVDTSNLMVGPPRDLVEGPTEATGPSCVTAGSEGASSTDASPADSVGSTP